MTATWIDVDDIWAPPRLSRSQLAQKVGARGHYPRPGGTLVPCPLAEIVRQTVPARDWTVPPSGEERACA